MACGGSKTVGDAAPGDRPLSTADMLRDEFAHVLGDEQWASQPSSDDGFWQRMHSLPTDRRPSALCLSGGGIRSATFCLGVLQWLAQKGQLKDFNYLSTVSGGGYIGSWLVNGLWRAELQGPGGAADWLSRVGQSSGSVGGSEATGAARSVGTATDPIAPLRAFSNYLSPTGGMSGDAFSLAAIFIRNLLLNALVWLSLLAALVAAPRLYIALLGASELVKDVPFLLWPFVAAAFVAIVWGIAYIVADLPEQRNASSTPTAPSPLQQQAAAASDGHATSPRDRFIRHAFAPIVVAAIVLSVGGAWIATLRETSWWWYALAGAVAHLAGVACGVPWRIRRGLPKRGRNVWGVVVVVFVGACGGALASVALSQLGAMPVAIDEAGSQRLLYATFAVPAMTGAFWLAMALYAGLMGRFTDEQDREWWARATAYWLRFSVIWMMVFALVVWLPLPLLDRFGAVGPTALQFGVGGGALGVVTSLIGYWSKNGADLERKARSLLRATRIRLLDAMAILVVVATLLALSMGWSTVLDRCHGWYWTGSLCTADLHAQTEFLRERKRLRTEFESAGAAGAPARAAALAGVPDAEAPPGRGLSASAQAYRHVLLEGAGPMLAAATVALMAFSAALALLMGVNVFSLHGMYRNRLVRAYLGVGRAQRRPHWFTGFDPDDDPELEHFGAPLRGADGLPRLYPVINIALNAVRASPRTLDWLQRKAAPFIATPRHCGAAATGFRPTAKYAGGMSLGHAMTISGAAASPNMGYHSSPPVTFVMALFNVRLGWWSASPGLRSGRRWTQDQPWLGLDIAIAEATGRTGVEDPFVYLSDGGHFDNLGIYEMVRRRCRRIVAVDATCDGNFKWTDLLDVVRKIRVDLGVPIELPAALPGPGRDSAHLRRIEAPIRYSARDKCEPEHDGLLVVLKPRLLPQDPPELAAYAAASAAEGRPADDPARFPHQSTADQFFDEQQFESYRLLGYTTAADTLDAKPSLAAASRKLGRRAAEVVPPGVAAAGGSAQPQADGGGGGFGRALAQLGEGAALATALTIGGTLGVAGTVALTPSEIRLSGADRALLKEGLNVRMDAGVLKLNDDDRRLLNSGIRVSADGSALIDPANRLSDAAEHLFAAADHLLEERAPLPTSGASAPQERVTVILDPGLRQAMSELRTEIAELRRRIRGNSAGGTAQADDPGLTGAVVKLQATLETLERRLPTEPTLAKALQDLKEAIEKIAPRRNVRGQDGGTR